MTGQDADASGMALAAPARTVAKAQRRRAVSRRAVLIATGGPFAAGLWIVRRVWWHLGWPNGLDITFHVTRTDFALVRLAHSGQYDGWNPGMMAGGQEFLVYGPGAALLTGLIHVLTFAQLSDESSMALLLCLAYAATAPAAWLCARALRLGNVGAAAFALGSLTVSMVYGPGVHGTYLYGLLNHQVATPLAFVAIASYLRLLDGVSRRWSALAAATTALLIITHLQTAIVSAIVFLTICFWRAMSRDRLPGFGRAVKAAALALGLAGIWLVPFIENHGPIAGGASFTTLRWSDYALDFIDGRGWTHPVIAVAATVASIACVIDVLVLHRFTRPLGRNRLAVALCAPTVFALLYLVRAVSPVDLRQVIVIRGLGLTFMFGLLPLAYAIDRLARERILIAALLIVAFALVPNIVRHDELARPASAPTPELARIASYLRDNVADHAKYAWVEDAAIDRIFGIGHPEYWVHYTSGRNMLNGFGGFTVSSLPYGYNIDMRYWAGPRADYVLRGLGVTHVVSTLEFAKKLEATPHWRRTIQTDDYVISTVVEPGNHGVGLVKPSAVRLERYEPEFIEWRVDEAQDVLLGMPYFRKWHFRFDGRPIDHFVDREGIVGVHAPGPGTIVAEYDDSPGDYIGRFVTVGTIAWWRVRARRSRRPRPPAPLAATGPQPNAARANTELVPH